MNNVEFLIISSKIDYSTDFICIELEKRKVKYLRLNRDVFEDYDILYSLLKDEITVKINNSVYSINSSSLKAIYFRAPVFYRCTGKSYSVQEQLKRSQWSAFIRNLLIFDKALWINDPVATYRAENKILQLKYAKECGLCVPETYLGNSLPQTIEPANTYIAKSLDTALFYDNDQEMFTYSTMLSGQDLLNSEIKSAPIIIQPYLKNKVDIRVTIIGNQFFSVKITDKEMPIVGDWRKHNKDCLNFTPFELPVDIKSKLLRLMKKFNLLFGGVDLAFVNDKYYFIEVNPTGEWGWLTSDISPIDKAIVNSMIRGV